jgi:hypothetical protein
MRGPCYAFPDPVLADDNRVEKLSTLAQSDAPNTPR